jgi:predicted CXXCH cytochrome family protein
MRRARQTYTLGRCIPAAGLALLACAGAAVWKYRSPASNGSMERPVSEAPPVKRRPANNDPNFRAVKPPPPPDDYVGSEVCARCHESIAETYRRHPMFRSAGAVRGDNDIENYDHDTDFQPPGSRRRYRVEQTDTGVVHHEYMADEQGEAIYDMAVPVLLFIGSGTRGRTYAVEHGGRLFESPLSWFNVEGGKWDLSPGYQASHHQRFERRIADICMMCHAGRLAGDPQTPNTFLKPVLLEAEIGCERCHGPGARHVARHDAGDWEGDADNSIVNPARLDPDRRESVCNQCHLQGKMSIPRYGRTAYDFRPGELLEDVLTVVVDAERSKVGQDSMAKAVSQVQQMRLSACYQKSDGQMSCSSCHDPHSVPEHSLRVEYFRSRCMECHAQRGCTLPAAERALPPAENSCIECHMPRLSANDIPHASQTDHRVVRLATVQRSTPATASKHADIELFGRAEERMAGWEIDRIMGLALVHSARPGGQNESALQEAEMLLRSALNAAPDDVLVLNAMGVVAASTGRTDEAREFAARAVEISPTNDESLQLLTELCYRAGDFDAGIDYGERLLAINRWRAVDHARQSAMYRKTGQARRAAESDERLLELDPTNLAARRTLVQTYRDLGDDEEAERQAEILRKLEH